MSDVILFLGTHKWWWLTPLVVIAIAVGALILLGHHSTDAPFVYSVF